MRRLWSILRWLVAGLLVLVLGAGVFGVWTARRSFPRVEGDLTVGGLTEPVTVLRDEWGVAHLYGSSLEDLAMAQGYVHAQDRFWEMDVRRHVTGGRLSELFGEGQIDTDRFLRTMGWQRIAEEEFGLLEPRSQATLSAYAAGVNAYLEDRSPSEVSLEYAVVDLTGDVGDIEPWEPADSLAWLKAMAYDLRSNTRDEIERVQLHAALGAERAATLDPAYPYSEFPPIVENDVVAEALSVTVGSARGGGLGSNSWVVSGDFTESGAAVLANDPHLAPSQPGIWYPIGVHCTDVGPDCPLNVTGLALAGVPGVVIGRNDTIAWGLTNLSADVGDYYVERVDGDRYEVDGEMVDMDIRTDTIEVAGSDPVDVRIRSTRHGPVLSDVSETLRSLLDVGQLPGMELAEGTDHAISLRWTALDPGRTFDALMALNVARDVDAFRQAAALFEVPAQNLVYADVDGNIAYQSPGRFPIRAEGHDGRVPAAGWTTETDWVGEIPFEDLPYVLNPDDGFIATANEAVVGPGYPYSWPGEWAPGFRSASLDRRIREALSDGATDVNEMLAIQMENEIGLAEILVDDLLAVEVDGRTADTRDLLRTWDGSMDADSPAAAFFGATMRHLLLATFRDQLPDEVGIGDRGSWWLILEALLEAPDDEWWDDTGTDRVETRDDVIALALERADADLVERLGSDIERWAWGDIHTLTLRHGTLGESGIGPIEALFNRGPFETSGAGSVVNATGWDLENGYTVTWVPSMRIAVDLGEPDAARWINLTGVSGHAFHPHYVDMTPLWAAGDTVPWRMTRGAVAEAAIHELTLEP